ELITGELVTDYTSAFFIFGGQFTKQQNNSLFPIKTTARISNEIGSRKIGDLSTNQFRTKVLANHIFQLNDFNSIYLNNQTEIVSSDTFLINELVRFGGINSIRGFDENSINASMFSVLNTEYRYQLGNDAYIHTIMDIAYFENKITPAKSQLYSFGIGLGMSTKAGIFKLNIANGKLKDQSFKLSNTKIHLSLTTVF
ncbi:MAG: BamA/TamA family outer membrane protein, partial [Flavobacteriia bacterium]|nr:BamA/TamA family outer membrane protein [Flavobacteriia bacterium]